MKKILYGSLFAFGIISMVSCSSDEEYVTNDGDGVRFTVRIPGNLATRGTFGDGTDNGDRATLNNLQWTVFEVEADGSLAPVFSDLKKDAFGASQTDETVTLALAKGKTYKVAFYADDNTNNFVEYADGKIKVNYLNAASNTAAEDAFIGQSKEFTVSGAYNEEVVLTRPFAQLNWGTDDTTEKSILPLIETLTGSVVITNGLYGTMDVISGEVSNPVTDAVTFSAVNFNNLPKHDFPIQKEEEDAVPYKLIAMNYLLTGNGTIDCSLNFNNGLTSVEVNSAPVKVNYRTNIFGSLLTAPGTFDIKVDNNFNQPDNNVKVVTSSTQLEDALLNGGEIEIPAGATINFESVLGTPTSPTLKVTKPTELTVNGTLSCGTGGQIEVKAPLHISGNGSIDTGIRGAIFVTAGGSLTAEDVTFNSPKAYRGGDVWNEGGGSMTFNKVTFNSNMASVYFQPAGADDTLTMDGCTVNNTSRNSIVNPETNEKTWSYAIRIQGGKATLSNMTVNGIQGGVAVGRGAICDIMSGTYTVTDSEPGKGDGFYALYVARLGVANVYGGKFSALRPAVYNGNEDVEGDDFGFVNLFGGKYSSKGQNQNGDDFKLPTGYVYKELTGQDPYKWEVVKE